MWYYVWFGKFWGLWESYSKFRTLKEARVYASKLSVKWKITDDDKRNIIDNSENYQN